MSAFRSPAIAYALVSAALFGASTPMAKLLLRHGDPWLIAGLLYVGSGLGLVAFTILRRRLSEAQAEASLRSQDVPWLIAVIACGGIVGPVLLMFGLAVTDAATGALLLNLEGIATLVLAWVAFREPVDRRLLVGAAAIVLGALLLSWGGGAIALRSGAILIAAACLAWGIDNNLTRKLSGADPVQIALAKSLVAGLVNLALALSLRRASVPSASELVGCLLLGAIGYGASLVLFIQALRHLGTARTGAYFSTAPFIGAAIAIPLSSAPVGWPLIVAGLLMGIGVYLHATEVHGHEHTHEPLRHSHRHSHDDHHRHEHADGDPAGEPHTHEHVHGFLRHHHAHFPDIHHRHDH
ncbi:MAG: DMT family transporter [Proteobacteria bacterium]|nr:DMT family transporter [Pseudomonadota bacterium]